MASLRSTASSTMKWAVRSSACLSCAGGTQSLGSAGDLKGGGRFTLIGIPREAKALRCWTPGGDTYLEYEDQVPADARSDTIITVGLKIVPTLEGVISDSRGKPIPHALVKVTDALGVTVKDWANDNGQVLVKNLKAGAGTIRYVADGYQEKPTNIKISERTNLSMVFTPTSTPVGLLLLIPGIVVLASWAAVDLARGTRAEGPSGDVASRSSPRRRISTPMPGLPSPVSPAGAWCFSSYGCGCDGRTHIPHPHGGGKSHFF